MKKLLTILLITLFTLFACGKDKESDPIQNIESLKQKAKTYEALIAENGPYALTTRCDSLTFVGLYASINKDLDLYKHFYESTWHRSVTPCYIVGDSRSEISLEGILSALHFMLSKGDLEGIEKLFMYGEHNSWVFGEGPEEYTKMPQLRPLLSDFIARKLVITAEVELPSFKGYRGNVVALYIALKGRMFDYINGFEMRRLKDLRRAEPSNPIYHALVARYEEGNQSKAISILSNLNHFPADRLPEQSLELFAWNDAPAAILFMWCVFLMED